jgi:hypothetical protein
MQELSHFNAASRAVKGEQASPNSSSDGVLRCYSHTPLLHATSCRELQPLAVNHAVQSLETSQGVVKKPPVHARYCVFG